RQGASLSRAPEVFAEQVSSKLTPQPGGLHAFRLYRGAVSQTALSSSDPLQALAALPAWQARLVSCRRCRAPPRTPPCARRNSEVVMPSQVGPKLLPGSSIHQAVFSGQTCSSQKQVAQARSHGSPDLDRPPPLEEWQCNRCDTVQTLRRRKPQLQVH